MGLGWFSVAFDFDPTLSVNHSDWSEAGSFGMEIRAWASPIRGIICDDGDDRKFSDASAVELLGGPCSVA